MISKGVFSLFQLFVTMLERSPEPAVRTNLVLAFGDFLFRFPNLIEPWTHHLYARYDQLLEITLICTIAQYLEPF